MTNGHNSGDGIALINAEQFAIYLEKRLGLHDQVLEVVGREGTTLRLRVNGREVAINVANFYEAYRSQPGQLDTIVQTMVRVLTSELPERSEQSYEALSPRIFPMLKPIAMLATVRERNLPMIVYRDFLADLMITYVVNEPRSVTFINEQHLEQWGVSAQDLHEQALENLRRRTVGQVDYVTTGEGEQRLFIFNSQDGYDATRLLLSEILAEWARQLPGRIVIGIPNRDFLVAFSDANDEILRSVAMQVQADAAGREYGLTDQLFTFEGGLVREYEWT
ncbi:MAG TPA: DUF5688 family protein [Roseiflexaceae bacterium]|nr:DUF5688 family protein [Roseiflexaceae bacterium]